jgi:hypothetical protein
MVEMILILETAFPLEVIPVVAVTFPPLLLLRQLRPQKTTHMAKLLVIQKMQAQDMEAHSLLNPFSGPCRIWAIVWLHMELMASMAP